MCCLSSKTSSSVIFHQVCADCPEMEKSRPPNTSLISTTSKRTTKGAIISVIIKNDNFRISGSVNKKKRSHNSGNLGNLSRCKPDRERSSEPETQRSPSFLLFYPIPTSSNFHHQGLTPPQTNASRGERATNLRWGSFFYFLNCYHIWKWCPPFLYLNFFSPAPPSLWN